MIGERTSGDPENEEEHFINCGACGQELDCRDLEQVFHHEDPGHGKFPDPRRLCKVTSSINHLLGTKHGQT